MAQFQQEFAKVALIVRPARGDAGLALGWIGSSAPPRSQAAGSSNLDLRRLLAPVRAPVTSGRLGWLISASLKSRALCLGPGRLRTVELSASR